MTADKQIDFTPFDAEANLEAVNNILRSVRHMSWSYAGDITRIVKKISQTFDAGRCILFAAREGGIFDVYEYSEQGSQTLSAFFASSEGQSWLNSLVEGGEGFISSDKFVELESKQNFEPPSELLDPPSHIVPLKNPYTSRYGIKPGFMLIQESRGLKRWNKKQLGSIVIVAEYLAMVIECERLTNAMQIESNLGNKIPGVFSRRRFTELAEWELSKVSENCTGPVFILIGFPQRTRLSLPQIIKEADEIFARCAIATQEARSKHDLVGYWKGDLLAVFSLDGGNEMVDTLKGKVKKAFDSWAEESGVGTTMEDIPAFGVASYPADGKSLESLYLKALERSKIRLLVDIE